MSKVFLVIAFLLAFAITDYSQTNSWRGIVPLKSTRADVEKLETIKSKKPCEYGSCQQYETETEIAEIYYAVDKCKGASLGWDVPKDTVMEIEIYDKSKNGKSAKELNLNLKDFVISVDDAFFATWSDIGKGIQYYFMGGGMSLKSISYLPKSSDNNLRCNGFPPYNPVSYYPFVRTSWKDWNTGVAVADSLMIEVDNRKGEDIGYLVFYSGKNMTVKDLQKYLQRVKNRVFGPTRNYDPNKLKFIEGGRRENFEIIAYLLPKDLPPPTPDPSFPSTQFMKKNK